jgi:osmotically-inducible protein OsmY
MNKGLGIGAVAGGVTAYVLRDRLRVLIRRAGDRAERAGNAVGGGTKYTFIKDNDPTLARKVESELYRDGRAPKGTIDVNAQDGVVQLRGVAESQELIDDAVQRARSVDGVRDVENLLHLPGVEAPMHQ